LAFFKREVISSSISLKVAFSDPFLKEKMQIYEFFSFFKFFLIMEYPLLLSRFLIIAFLETLLEIVKENLL